MMEKKVVNNKTVGIIGVELRDFVIKKYPWYQAPFAGLYETTTSSITAVVSLPSTIGGLFLALAGPYRWTFYVLAATRSI